MISTPTHTSTPHAFRLHFLCSCLDENLTDDGLAEVTPRPGHPMDRSRATSTERNGDVHVGNRRPDGADTRAKSTWRCGTGDEKTFQSVIDDLSKPVAGGNGEVATPGSSTSRRARRRTTGSASRRSSRRGSARSRSPRWATSESAVSFSLCGTSSRRRRNARQIT